MTETCATCRYWQRYEGADLLKNGGCLRFPQHVFKDSIEYCGEHRPATQPAALQAAALLVAQSHISGPTGDTVEVPRTFFEPFCKLLGVKPR